VAGGRFDPALQQVKRGDEHFGFIQKRSQSDGATPFITRIVRVGCVERVAVPFSA
jgi:hypothetical protein